MYSLSPGSVEVCPSPRIIPPSPTCAEKELPWKSGQGDLAVYVSSETTKIVPVDMQTGWNQSISSLESLASPPCTQAPTMTRLPPRPLAAEEPQATPVWVTSFLILCLVTSSVQASSQTSFPDTSGESRSCLSVLYGYSLSQLLLGLSGCFSVFQVPPCQMQAPCRQGLLVLLTAVSPAHCRLQSGLRERLLT